MLDPSTAMTRRLSCRLALCAVTATLALLVAAAARAASPGTLDTSFGSGGIASTGGGTRLLGAVVQSDGKLLAVGESGVGTTPDLLLARFTTSGALDSSFGSGGIVHGPSIAAGEGSIGRAVAVQSNGQIVVVGSATDSSGGYPHGLIVERYNSGGGLDTSFGSHGVADELSGLSAGDGYAVAVQPDGKIIATGAANAAGSGGVTPRVAVVRLDSNGSLDTSFAGGGQDVIDLGAYSYALAVALQTNGSIVIAGSQAPGLQVPNALIARLTPSGALDSSFAGTGAYAHQYAQGASNSAFNAVAVQPDGAIVAAGAATAGNTGADAFVVRFTSGGSQDGSFGSGGVAYTPSATNFTATGTTVPGASGITIAPNGDIIAAGTYANSVQTSATLWAFRSNGSLDSSFGSGGTAELTSQGISQYAAIALSPINGDLLAVGDSRPAGAPLTGIVTELAGFGQCGGQASVGYRDGLSAGFNSGFKSGFNSGFRGAYRPHGAWNIGFQSGWKAGRRARFKHQTVLRGPQKVVQAPGSVTHRLSSLAKANVACQTFNSAFNSGFATGFQSGFHSGFNAAFNSAFHNGFQAGFKAGRR